MFEKITHTIHIFYPKIQILVCTFKPLHGSNPCGEGVQVWKTSIQQCIRLTGQTLAKLGVLLQYSWDNRAWISRIPKWMNECVFICHASVGEELRYQDCLISCNRRLWAQQKSYVTDTAGAKWDIQERTDIYKVIFSYCLNVKYLPNT